MQLTQLIAALPDVQGRVGGNVEVYGAVTDSRQVRPGDLFVAISGANVDGHHFISEALREGAVAVVGERLPQELPDLPWGTFAYVRVLDARQAWDWLREARGSPAR